MSPQALRGFEVAEIASLDPNARTLSVHVLSAAPQFEGHFPGAPVLPAVAQLCDLVLPAIELAWPDLPPLSGSPRIKFSGVIAPGAQLTLTLVRDGSKPAVRFELRREEGTCASGTLHFGP